jgi:hypothetical protein
MVSRCPREGCRGRIIHGDDGLVCLACGRAPQGLSTYGAGTPLAEQPLGSLSTADLVTLFKQLHESAQRNWQARVAVIAELASRIKGSGRNRCREVAAMIGISEPYTRQLYKVSKTFSHNQLTETKVKPSTVIAAAYSPEPERWLKRAEAEKLREQDVWRGTRAEKEPSPAGRKPAPKTVYARCQSCGNVGWHDLVLAPETPREPAEETAQEFALPASGDALGVAARVGLRVG